MTAEINIRNTTVNAAVTQSTGAKANVSLPAIVEVRASVIGIQGPPGADGSGGSGGSVAWADVTGKPTFATVATSGAYSDLTGKPTLATVATSGAYSDLTGKPTLGTAAAAATTDFATAAQGAKADTALQPAAIGVSVQGYSATLAATTASYTTAEQTKLAGIATGATANSSDATLLARANHTGTQSADTLTDGTTNKAFLATERTKLAGIATGATANSSDATLLARANHTGTQLAATISDFTTAVQTVGDTRYEAIHPGGTGTLTLSSARLEHEEAITASGVTAGMRVNVFLQAGTDSDENTADMIDLVSLAGTAGSGTITVSANFSQPTSGPILINWSAE